MPTLVIKMKISANRVSREYQVLSSVIPNIDWKNYNAIFKVSIKFFFTHIPASLGLGMITLYFVVVTKEYGRF